MQSASPECHFLHVDKYQKPQAQVKHDSENHKDIKKALTPVPANTGKS